MTYDPNLRSFNFNQADLQFILQQIEFRPLFTKDVSGNLVAVIDGWSGTSAIYDQYGNLLFDPLASYTADQVAAMARKAFAPFGQVYDAKGNAVVGWNGTGAIYDAHGNQIWAGAAALTPVAGGAPGTGTLGAAEAISIFGTSYGTFNTGSAVTDIAGLRNVSGEFNNLNPGQSGWGAVDGLFARTTPAGYGHYSQEQTGPQTTETSVASKTASVDGPSSTETVIVNGAKLTFSVFTRTATTDTFANQRVDNHHLLVNTDTTTETTTVTRQQFVNGVAAGSAAVVGTPTVTTSTSLSGGELDPAYHPQLRAFDPSNPAAYVPNLARDPSGAVDPTKNHDYSVTFTVDPTTKAITTNESSVVDYTPRMIAQTITQSGTPVQYLKMADPTAITHDPLDATSTGGFAYSYESGTGVVLLRDGLNHIVYWNSKEYDSTLVKLVETDITAGHHDVAYYRALADGTVVGQNAQGHNVLWNAAAYNYSKPIYDNNIDTHGLIEGAAVVDTSIALLPGQADGTGGATSQGDANLYSGAGYGTLSMTGQHDKQNTDANNATGFGDHEYFDGNVASIAGNAPNNGWFVLFGQFFDHGLDFIGKSSTYQIVVPLAVDDPLYGVIGPDGQPTTSITINRAIVAGPVQQTDPVTGAPTVDANGNPVYVPGYQNHDSPYIDQSQTYGSQLDTDNILRNWVKDPNTGAWHPGDTLVDGHTVAPYKDAFGNMSTSTLPTLNELRTEIQTHGGGDVGGPRADLTWEDVSQGLRERNPDGSIKLVGGQPVQLSEPLLLDMNPHFDSAHITQAALDAINAQIDAAGLSNFGVGHLSFDGNGDLVGNGAHGAGALAPFLDFADFSISADLYGAPSGTPAIGADLHAAIGELMMESVGDHYIAGDGRANENVGLTAVHHVFHEEHGYQVQNIETYVLGIDAENVTGSDAAHPHATAHDWEVAVDAKAAITNPFVETVADAGTSSGFIYDIKAAGDAANPTLVLARDADGNIYATSGANPGDNASIKFASLVTTQSGQMIAADEGVVARDANGNFYVTSALHPTDGANGAFAGFVQDQAGGLVTADGSYTDAAGYISWDQDKMFNAAKMTVEMEYQHIAVDQYSRAVSPNIQEFAGYTSDKNADISLEYGEAAFRFGHSTLRETIDTMDPTGGITGKIMSYALEQAFLNPGLFAQVGPGSIALGMERQLMNEVDNYITPSLNEGLLGQPLDLATINLARGRDIGMPTLNEAKTALGQKAYADWNDFGQQMMHPVSLVDFIAAYSFDGDMTKAQTIVDLNSGVQFSALSSDEQAYASTLGATYADQHNYAVDFMNGGDKGIDDVDLWIGGLAETHVAGGVLGETFDSIFVTQIENLMDGDRFYYLQRLVNQQFGNEIQNEQFKDLVERNTGVTNLNGNIFAYADQYYDESKAAKVATADLNDPTKLGDLYQGSKSDGSWHQVFQVDATGHAGTWLDANGNAATTQAPPAGALYDLWGQEVTDLFASDGHKVFDRASMTWLDSSYDPAAGAASADKPVYFDQNTDPATGISPGGTSPNFLLTELGADQHKYGQVVDAHAGDANTYGSGTAKDGVNDHGVTVIDESQNTGVGIWSVGGTTTAANGSIAEHHFTLPLNDGLSGPDASVSPLLTAAGAIGWINPADLPSDHITVDENFILDLRPDGSTINKDGSLDTGADSAEVLVGTQYNDYIELGIGDDTGYGGAGNDIIFGGKSNAGHNTLYGGDGADILVGGDAPDLIDGGNGDDWIWGASSGSSVNGVDQLIGGNGNDHIFGGIGIDKIFGGTGDDFIYGGQDTDPTVFGGDGNDYMNGGSGVDVMNGDAGDDIMDGGPGVDQLFGGSGDDILRPGPGVTSVGGNGGGADVLIGGDSQTGPNGQTTDDGFDFADYSQQTVTSGIVGDLANQALVSQLPQDKTPLPVGVPTATTSGDVWFEMEGVIGTKNADVLRGDGPTDVSAVVSHGDNWLVGGSGNDVLEGRGGNDVIVGGSIRLDTLIGTYKDGGPNGTQDPYTSDVDGASHRVSADATLSGGLLDYASAHGVAGITYADHFTDLLKSGAYKDYVFGDGSAAGGTDTATYSGAQSDYRITFLPFTDAHGTLVQAFQVQDLRPGSPDGTDLLVGISKLEFNYDETANTGTVVNLADLFPTPTPTITSPAVAPTFAENTAQAVAAAQDGLTPAGTSVASIVATGALAAFQISSGVPAPTLTWSIANTDAVTQNLFALTASSSSTATTTTGTASLTFKTAPNFEALVAAGAVPDAHGNLVFNVQVQVSNGSSAATQTEKVTITNVDESGTGAVHLTGATVDATGNTVTFAGTNTLSDPDVAGTPLVTYSLTNGTAAVGAGASFTGGSGAIQQLHLVGTYHQPAPLPDVSVASAESAFVGTAAPDKLVGTTGADLLIGLGGNDTYVVDNIGDVVVGGANGGTDTVWTSLGSYTLGSNVENLNFADASGNPLSGAFSGTGNALDNVITGGKGANTISAGDGNDTIKVTYSGVPTVASHYDGGAGTDSIDYSANTTGVTVGMAAGTVTFTGGAATDTIANIENVTTGSGNDTFVAAVDAIANAFDGGGGVNTISYATATAAQALTVTMANGTIAMVGGATDTIHNIQNIVGGAGNDVFYAAADTVANIFDGGAGTNRIDYTAVVNGLTVTMATGAVTFTDGSAADTIRSIQNVTLGAGNDTLVAAVDTVANAFDGGAGIDTSNYAAYTRALTFQFNGSTASTVVGSGTTTATSDTLANFENFYGGSGGNAVTVSATDTANHVFKGGAGVDSFVGGVGNDTVIATVDNVRDTYNGSSGSNTADYSAYTTALSVDFSLATATVGGSGTSSGTSDQLTNFQNFIGGSGNDTLVASTDSQSHRYDGGGGANTIDLSHYGAATNLTVDLTAFGTPELVGGTTDTIVQFQNAIGGAGNDLFKVGNDGLAHLLDGRGGSDTADLSALTANLTVNMGTIGSNAGGLVAGSTDTLRGIENVVLGAGNDTAIVSQDGVAHTLDGGAGNDTVDFSNIFGNLTVNLNTGSATGLLVGDTIHNFENVSGGSGSDTIVFAAGDTANHSFDGRGGTNTIDFAANATGVHADFTTAVAPSASITLNNFANVLGGAGADTVKVGTGTLAFTGGAGADTLVFGSLAQLKNGTARDVFSDFTVGTDKINLAGVDANTTLAGTQHFAFSDTTALWNGAGNEFAAGSAGQARYHTATVNGTTHTILDLHTTNAAGAADHQIDLGAGVKTIHATDLILA